MDKIIHQGQLLFAVAVAASGAEQLICAGFRLATGYIIPWLPGNSFFAYVLGVMLLAAGLSIATNKMARVWAFLLGFGFLVCVLLIWLPEVVAHPASGTIRTRAFETLSFGASALILAGLSPADERFLGRWEGVVNGLITSGPYLFAVSSVVFGVDHFLFPTVIASLVPAWIPGPGLFWAYLTGTAFIAAGISIATGWIARWAAILLGIMYLLWFLVLHSPRSISASLTHNPNAPNEWSSAFVALGMCGGAWIFARSSAEAPSE
jgi:uncharacterized membrane protein YphA (DoxX/SURF4 family)